MTLTVRTGSWARRFIPETVTLTLAEGTTVSGLLEMLPVPPDEIGMAAIEGRVVPRDTVLQDGDAVELLPAIIGG
jgi:sulfur carrier protein ThiS